MADKDERELVYGLKENEESYQKTLVDRYAGLLLKIVMDRGLSREDGLEVVNDTFDKAIKNINGFDVNRNTKFSAWIVKIAIRTATDKYRQIEKSLIDQSIEERLDRGIQDTEDLWQDLDAPESQLGSLSKDLIKKALQRLSDTDQIILTERSFDQEHKQIATLLKKSDNAVKVAYHRALKSLRKEYINLLESLKNEEATLLKTFLHIEDINEETAN